MLYPAESKQVDIMFEYSQLYKKGESIVDNTRFNAFNKSIWICTVYSSKQQTEQLYESHDETQGQDTILTI